MISGVINVYKEKGYTSHDVVAKLRGILRQKKIGHTGTLDPQAEGVLLVCLGSGTKLCDMLTDRSKSYEAVLLLGQTTDTQDTTGEVLETCPVDCDPRQVKEAVLSFLGGYDQIPPMYSALKVQGKKLYELARAGIEVERRPRRVELDSITVEEIALPYVRFSVSCSKGTYIRTLCQDIGEKLGCGGCMESLKRTRVGSFMMKESLKLSEIEELQKEGRLIPYIHPVDSMFPMLSRAAVLEEYEKLLKNGNPLKDSQIRWLSGEEKRERLLLYDTDGNFCGIYGWNEKRNYYNPEKMFPGE